MNREGMRKLIGIILVSYIVISCVIILFSDLNEYSDNFIDDQITVTVIHEDGKVNTYGNAQINRTNQGDKVIAKINLPKEKYIKDASICLRVYNSVVHMYYEDTLIYEYGEKLNREGRLIGAVFINAEIPEEAWGNSLRLECDITEDYAISGFHNVMLIKTVSSLKYYLVGHQTEFIVFITIILVAPMVFFTLLFYGSWDRNKRKWMHLCNYCTCLAVWLISYNGMYHLTSENMVFFSNMEYIGIYLSPFHMMLYLYEEQKDKKVKRYYGFYTWGYLAFFLLLTVLNYTTRELHYSEFIPLLHLYIAGTVIITIREFFYKKQNHTFNKTMLKYGIIFTTIVFCLELFRYNIEKYTFISIWNTNSFSALSILIMLVMIALSYALQLAESLLGEKEKQYLQRMAYMDGLTGLANRTGCYEYFESMSIRQCKLYTIIYMDLNNLKPLNDNYGHDEGDKLICFLAEALKSNFQCDGFCGRLGGDEFVVVVEESHTIHVPEYMNRMMKAFTKANEEKQFPLPVSVAYGMASSTEENPLEVMEAVKIADGKMYEIKKRYKENE